MNDFQNYINAISTTGFLLENKVAQILKRNNWQVISNKYYIDDLQETVKEIDLIAYKCRHVQGFDIYTSLVISCKKSATNAWGLIAREIRHNDPNTDFEPFHGWSNNKSLDFELSKEYFAKNYYSEGRNAGLNDLLKKPDFDIFAFQEIDKTSAKAKNDSAIFSSITSLMKAQAYELSVLPERIKNQKRKPAIYQFNLISLTDTELIRFVAGGEGGEEVSASLVSDADYITHYIINSKETFVRIRFINYSAFEEQLNLYNALHEFNCKFFKEKENDFFNDAIKNREKRSIYEDEFTKEAIFTLNSIRYDDLKSSAYQIKDIELSWNNRGNHVWIDIDDGVDAVEASDYYSSNTECIEAAKKLLLKYYRYNGAMKFSFILPF